ncbi:MAG TPA: tetratricopeptide repeat protein [Pyrinomonadaceae bacterium]|nr:tetratricopeptide repeat protein [Pyrinomonadaceae bacterium]
MNLADKRLWELDDPSLTTDDSASRRCHLAADLINTGQYETAREALGGLWQGTGIRPNVEGLEETTAAEALLQCGSLTGWLGTSKRVEGAQEAAKDLISEALRIFDAHGLSARVAEAQYELGMCYWRSGAFDEARVILQEALRRLGETDLERKAKILIRSTLVEISAGRYNDALRILNEAEPVFRVASDAVKGKWHSQMALVLRRLGMAEARADYLDRAIIEFTAAIYHFEQAGHERYCANNLNNIAPLLAKLGRYREAHEHLDRAQMIFTRLRDPGNLAQVDESRARLLVSEKRYREAARIIASVIETFEASGEPALLADALTVRATVEARLGQNHLSLPTFRRAIQVAEEAGALESAGLATLALIEEHGTTRLSEEELYEAYARADELIRRTQDAEAVARLLGCARLIARRLGVAAMPAGFKLPEAVRQYEARFIRRAMSEAEGRITHAAKRLGVGYQTLQYLLRTRHKGLAPARPKRYKSIIKDPEQ